MKAPTHCPICGDPLLNIFPPAEEFSTRVDKSCNKRLSHGIAMICEDDEVKSLSIGLDRGTHLQATWFFTLREIWILNMSKKEIPAVVIPFFDPDFSNYKKLVNKIKTYLLFS